MLDATSFSRGSIDIDWEGPVWSCKLAAERLFPIGAEGARSSIPVFWLGSSDHPSPDRDWLEQSFPTAENCIVGFEEAFKEYCDSWCGEDMKEEILDTAEPSELQAFEEHGWLPFTTVYRILINPSARLICFECHCDIDYNLDEHGIAICFVDRAWRFGYGADWMQYFGD